MRRVTLRAAVVAICLAAAFQSLSSAASLADVSAYGPLSGPIVIETRWLHPPESNNPVIVGVTDEPGCCHPDYVYAVHYGLILGDPHSHSSGAIGR